MRRYFYYINIFMILIWPIRSARALVPLESLLLGDFSSEYVESETDPIEYIFRNFKPSAEVVNPDTDKDYLHKKKISLYRGFIDEGLNLVDYCKSRPKILYPEKWDRIQTKRSIYHTLQYIGLDLTLRALPKYAQFFEFSEEDYQNLGENLIGNYCSQNVTSISLRQLKKNWMIKFKEDNSFELPSIKEDPLFPEKLQKINLYNEQIKNEFAMTVELFKTFCSWGNDVDNLRLLVPLVRNPVVMSFIFRQLNGKKIAWEPRENKTYLETADKSVQIKCDNLICRKTDLLTFKRKIARGAGSTGLEEDFKRLYCEDLRDVDYTKKDQVPQIQERIKGMTFDEENFLVSQFIALLTGVPDFLLRAEKYSDGKEFFRASVDKSWNDWAKTQNKSFNRDMYYEESLTMELVDRNLYYNRFKRDFKVVFDINLGEFDRTNQIVGKINSKFYLNVSKRFLAWAREQWKNIDPRNKREYNWIISQFKAMIADDIERAWKTLDHPPWDKKIDDLIARELLEQLANYEGKFWKQTDSGMHKIPVEINYAPFALKYLRYKYTVRKNEGLYEERRARLEKLKL